MVTLIVCAIIVILLVPALVAGHSLAPWLPSLDEDVEAALDLAHAKAGEVFYDLGCGEGHALVLAARRGMKAVGIELAPLLFCVAWIRAVVARDLPGSISVRYGNLFKKDISDADVIFVYGLPSALRGSFAEKVQRDAKPGTRVVSCRFRIDSWKEKAVGYSAQKKNPTYLYEVG